jgi:hypothetical protein
MGIYYDKSTLTPPNLGTNWYYTTSGSFQNMPYCWGYSQAGGAGGVCDNGGVSANPQFVNPSAGTAAGYQLQSGSAPLTGGFTQIVQTQGPR